VQKHIDGNNEKYKPGRYFVLKFDFSEIHCSSDLEKANQNLITSLNEQIAYFYEEYAEYLGEDISVLRESIHGSPITNLQRCVLFVRRALSLAQQKGNEKLATVRGIYLFVDEYDSFANNYLEPPNNAQPHAVFWNDTEVGRTFRSFWSTVKSLCLKGIRKIFITGISPLSLSDVGSAFNIARNVSFEPDLAGLCGLTYSDLKDTLMEIKT